jgi:hypothetical protein
MTHINRGFLIERRMVDDESSQKLSLINSNYHWKILLIKKKRIYTTDPTGSRRLCSDELL